MNRKWVVVLIVAVAVLVTAVSTSLLLRRSDSDHGSSGSSAVEKEPSDYGGFYEVVVNKNQVDAFTMAEVLDPDTCFFRDRFELQIHHKPGSYELYWYLSAVLAERDSSFANADGTFRLDNEQTMLVGQFTDSGFRAKANEWYEKSGGIACSISATWEGTRVSSRPNPQGEERE